MSGDAPLHIEWNRESDTKQSPALAPLDHLILWLDPIARKGAEAMAVDEALLELGDTSILRIYHWGRPTVTYGYFDKESTARQTYSSPELEYIRRWTGGGIVDHRKDIPFTLALMQPKGASRPHSSDLYRWIHGTLARTLRELNVDCLMLSEDAPNGGRSCFSSPVTSDLVTGTGEKLAGGGQRRTRKGVLHQGSIQNCTLPADWATRFAARLADSITATDVPEPLPGLNNRVQELLSTRYETTSWSNGSRHAAE